MPLCGSFGLATSRAAGRKLNAFPCGDGWRGEQKKAGQAGAGGKKLENQIWEEEYELQRKKQSSQQLENVYDERSTRRQFAGYGASGRGGAHKTQWRSQCWGSRQGLVDGVHKDLIDAATLAPTSPSPSPSTLTMQQSLLKR